MRFIAYFTNVFLESLTSSQPYAKYEPVVEKKPMTEDEINSIKDLGQPENELDLEVQVIDSSIVISERPYLTQQYLEMQVEKVTITKEEVRVYNRHSNIKNFEMKLTKMPFLVENAVLLCVDQSCKPAKRVTCSSPLNIKVCMSFPSYSEILEKISSRTLEKYTEIELMF